MTERKRGFCEHQLTAIVAGHILETGGHPEFGLTRPDAPGPGGFTGQVPEMFLGRHVKLAFPTGLEGPSHERMWVRVERLHEGDSGEQLEGTIQNEPRFTAEWSYGSAVAFNVSEIIEVLAEAEA